MNFSSIFNSVINYFTAGKQDTDLKESLDVFKTYLNDEENTTIRVWVSGAVGYAHQTSTVNLIYQLTNNDDDTDHGFGYAGTIEVYYQQNADNTILTILQGLLPSLNGKTEGSVNQATVKLIQWKDGDKAPDPVVNLGFTGAEEQVKKTISTSPALATRLNTTYFLRLEPYLWTQPEEIQFLDTAQFTIDLSKQDLLQKGAFKQRPYWQLLPVAEPDWNYYALNGYADEVAVLQDLLEQTDSYDLGITYSITTDNGYVLQAPPEDRMFEAITGYLASQMNGSSIRSGAKPIILLSMDDFANRTGGVQTTIAQLIRGAQTGQEKSWSVDVAAGGDGIQQYSQKRLNELKQLLKPSGYRAQYLTGVGAASRVDYVWDATEETVKAKYSWLNTAKNLVLFVQIGKVPAPIFNYMLSKAAMPSIFAGSDTANLALQLGTPYFNVSKPNTSKPQYPTTLLGYTTFDKYPFTYLPMVYVPKVVSNMQRIANNINFRLEQWPAAADKSPAEIIGKFIRDYQASEKGDYQTYYANIRKFYQDPAADKFRAASSYLGYLLQPADPEKNPLTPLLKKLYDNLGDDDVLNLFPGVYGSGPIYNFVSGLLGTKVALTGAAITPDKDTEDPQEIVVTGNSDVLDGVPLAFEIKFTAPQKSVISEWKMTYTGDWLTSELPWLLFDQPYVSLVVADSIIPAQGSVGGILRGLDLDLSIRLPIGDGGWQLEGHFAEPASVSRFFQMAGGVNLVQALPSPFNALSSIGVTDCQMNYNGTAISYVSFVMSSSDKVQLMQGLSMDSLSFNVCIQDPGSLADRTTTWSVMGEFKIGATEDAGVIVLSMNYPGPELSGQLTNGVIKVTDLFNLFLPGTVFDPEGASPEVTEFEATFNGTSGNYSVSAKLNFDWTFQILPGAPSVTITDVGVQVESQDEALQGGINGGIIFNDVNKKPLLALTLSASYSSDDGWVFMGKQDEGTSLSLIALANQFLPSDWAISAANDYALKNLSFTFKETPKYYEIGGETDGPWTIPFIDLKVRADLKFGYGKYKTASGDKDSAVTVTQPDGKSLAVDKDKIGYYCTLNADIEWIGIKMKVFYDYNPDIQKYGFTWGVLTGYIAEQTVGDDPQKHWIGSLKFTESVTLGSMIEEAISWFTGYKFGLGAPWNLLNSIPLSALELIYDFTAKTVSFKLDVGEINLGFCKINKIGINYQSGQAKKEDNGVFITIDGSFFWLVGNDNPPGQSPSQIKWDASKPENTPAPSGQGNKYLDLRLLALGQHVTIPGFATATSVQEAIKAMATLPDTEPGTIPDIVFDPNSSWLVGMDFGILKLQDDKSGDKTKEQTKALLQQDDNGGGSGYFIDLQIVFNDPNLYALRIALSGAPARIFKGLDFQILYRKISDSIGVYQAQIALPDVMRKIQLGTVNITLPVFAIEVYTNGDFLVDLGFPKNADFSRSFTLQMLIYVPFPIPIMGSAGLYFGKKSSATSTEVPVIDNGTFNPVIVFGVGIQFGLGYDFNAGILAAGFSLTFVTIIEGVLAKFNPYQAEDTSTGEQADIAPSYYYSVKGVVGIQGKLYGYVDFKIIKAEVNVMLSVLADITITAYKPIILGLTASVSVSVSIKINLGLFSIKISFSFSMTIRQSYEIKVGGGKAPWHEVSGAKSQANTLQRTAGRPLQMRPVALASVSDTFTDTPVWSNLSPAATKAGLTGYLGFGLSMAGDMASTLGQQQAVYSAMLFIESVDPNATGSTDNGDTSFETLSKQIFRWVIAAFHNGAISASDVDKLPVSQVTLQAIYDYLNDPDNTDPIPATDIDAFLGQQVSMTVSHPSAQQGETNAAYFPIAPALSLSLPAFGQQPQLDYSFAGYNTLSENYIHDLRIYFDALAVKMQEDNGQAINALKAGNELTNNPESLATFIYTDYFLMIARQMIQNAQDALSAFQYTMPGNQTVTQILTWVNTNGQFSGYSYTVNDLFNDNKSHMLNAGKGLRVDAAVYATVSGDTFDNISKKSIYNNGFTANDLATLNADNTTILQSGVVINYPGKDAIVVQAGNSLNSIAQGFNVSLNDLLGNSNVLQLDGLLMPSSKLTLPAFTGLSEDGDTLVSFSARYGVSIDQLADEPANSAITDLFSSSDNEGKLVMSDLPQFAVGELINEIQENDGLRQLSGMASRYYLSGLRLPTDGITPAYQGMWINKDLQYEEATAGLFALTGQQFPLPVLDTGASYVISLTIPSGLTWMSFDTGKPTLEVSIDQKSDTYTQINTVRTYAQQNYLDLAIEQLGMGDMFSSSYGHYSFSTVSIWQAGSPVLLPYSGSLGDAQSLNIWTLPNDLISLADPVGRSVTPRFKVMIGTPDPVTKSIQSSDISNYAWGTQVTFTVKRVPVSPDSPASATTYEISGADGNNALILEQMVTYLNNNDSLIDNLVFGFAPDQGNGSNPGIQTDPIGSLTIGIAQANMSTFTRPDSVMGARATRSLQAQGEQSNLLNKPTALITLLWQASITRDGGYYLYYYNSENGEGLPDHAFNDKGEAALSLIVLYTAGATTAQQNLLQPYMNIFVTGDPVSSENTVYAKADPIVQNAVFGKDDTLSSIAFRYFTNIGDMAEANPDAPLSTGVDISIPEGVYQVRNVQGERLASIANTFGTSEEAIKAANPLVTSWPDPLPLYTGLRLPPLKAKGNSGNNTKTLAAVAAFYGMDLTALANYNSDKAGLLADQTTLSMSGGPVTRVATVPAGVVSLEAIRTAPADVPPNPGDKNYAQIFLQQNFSILSFSLVGNSWFNASNPSLPAGPTDPQSSDGYGQAPDQSGKWIFRQSVPYYKFANLPQGLKAGGSLPDASTSPYKGIGYLVQADFTWLDIYGNTIMTTLSQPPGATGVINEAPILTGYTDALLGINQWPSVSSAWQAVPGDQKQIQIPLSFDTTPYNGLLAAKATGSTSILLTFTEEVDTATATTLSNYKLSPELNISAANVQTGNKTVLLTVDTLSEDLQYTLSIGNIQNSGKTETFNGQATFSYPDVAAEASSSILQQAQHDFQTYTQLWYQLTDPNGMAMSMKTSLYPDPDDVFEVDEAAYSDLVDNWIASIYLYLQDRSTGGTSVAAPNATHTLSFVIDPSRVNGEQIFEVTLSLSITRTGGAVMGDFETTGGIKSVSTLLSPDTDSGSSDTKALDDFAEAFEQTMSIDQQYYLKIATGADRDKLGQQTPDGTIWAVRLGIGDAGPIAYSVSDKNTPALFAPKPVSNKLESRTGVPIYNYTTGKGIDFSTPSNLLDFTEIDLDQWVGTFFGAMDNVLTPEFTASIQLVDKKLGTQYLQDIQDSKKSLADIAKLLMVPVFAGESANAAAVQEALKQALLVKLSNLYATNSGIQFDVMVKADPVEDTPPNLYGNFLQNTLFEGAVSEETALTQVSLYFSAPMDPASANNTANYTLTAPITVKSAALSADGQSVVLTASDNVILNVTAVTIADTLLDVNKRPVQGVKTDTIATDYVSYAKPDQLTITSAKISLDERKTQPLAFLLTTPEIVRGQHGEVLSKIDLNLSYKATDIEHQIAAPVNGYTPSSWLSFVLPDTRVPLESPLGGFSVPMFLRSFPVNPSLVNQSGIAPYVNDPDISKLLQWEYVFDYSQSFHYPQDTLYCTVNFNVADGSSASFRAIPDAFGQLAEFIMVYPSIDADLKTIVTQVDATTYYETGTDAETLFKNAGIALDSFTQVVDRIVTAASGGNGLTMNKPPTGRLGSNNVDPYAFEIQEGPRGLDGQQVQVVSIYGAPPDGVGAPQVLISPDTYDMTPWVSTDDPCTGYICYYYINKTTGAPLLSDEAQNIQARRVVLPGLNILQRQDAMTTVYLTRNENLISGRTTSPDFVYTTGELAFSNPYLPTITSYQPIEIACLPANQGVPTIRTLMQQFQVLMATLLKENTEPELSFQMTCNYEYKINPDLGPITLPVMMQTIIKITLATGLDPMLQSWTTFITDWLSTNDPNTVNGKLKFDLVIFSNLTQQPYPIIRLTDLGLSLVYITPAS